MKQELTKKKIISKILLMKDVVKVTPANYKN